MGSKTPGSHSFVSEQKKQVRKELKFAVDQAPDKAEQSRRILENLNEVIQELRPTILGAFLPMPEEVNIEDFIVPQAKFALALPRWIDDQLGEGSMQFHLYRKKDDLEQVKAFGRTLVQIKETEVVVPDLLIVPGLGFTRKGGRLGRGKGFYDRYIAKNNIKTIGLSYREQLKDELPLESHDKLLDIVITADEVYR